MAHSNRQSAQMLATAADLLAQGQIVNRLSLAVTAIAVAVLLVPPFAAAALGASVVVALGIVELVCAIRINFDATLFARLATDAADDRLDMSTFDTAMGALKLMRSSKVGRPIADRFTGAKWLLMAQCVLLLLQLAAAIATGAFNFWLQFS